MLSKHAWQILCFILLATTGLATPSYSPSCHDGLNHERVPLRELPTDAQGLVFADTQYEELTCLGFNPQLNLLSATIQLKLSTGFNGNLCSNGSFEYVRFWVNYNGGWTDIGLASLNVNDLLDSTDCEGKPTKPLSYTLSINFDPKHESCGQPVLPMIRATLSWSNVPPANNPYWDPIWGNSLEANIESLATNLKPQPVMMPLNTNLTSQIDRKASADQQRYHETIEAITVPREQQVLGACDANTRLNIRQNVDFEEVVCVGIDSDFNSLIAHVRIKRPNGYNAPPCETNSFEFVSFWASLDDSCGWTFLGTARFNVHNFGTAFPPTGLVYTVLMPFDVSGLILPCKRTKIVRVRAALAFNKVPPQPPAVAARGNFIETHVHINPKTAVSLPTDPHIRMIANVPLQQIDTVNTGQTLPNAMIVGYEFADPSPNHDRSCPFGGFILVRGEPIVGYLYRLMARPYSPFPNVPPGSPITNSFEVFDANDWINPIKQVHPIDNGYFGYLPLRNNFQMILGHWTPSPGDWQIRLEVVTDDAARKLVGETPWYRIFVNSQIPVSHLALDFPSGNPRCGDFTVGQSVTGTFDADSAYFGSYSLDVAPQFAPPLQVVHPGSVYQPAPPGTSWSIDTKGAIPCGYVVSLGVCDRTVVNSGLSRFCVPQDIGFCLLKPQP